ncbi:MAG TPA: 2-oxoacid:acceptor oxidoreductase family protein [Candidatus Eisenbacteria bacterium]|nr:2-oxoacid:acceptor oxidoreductase family protein [Candidatus Eisenbacteria bacterium]
MDVLDLRSILQSRVLEIRGDGRAGGGLVLAFQSLAGLMLRDPDLHVQEWPFFSSARRGAAIRSFLRVSARPIRVACEVTRPTMSVLMDESAARSTDFALGVPPGGTFVLNTRRSPEECARHFRLSGRVITISGNAIGEKHLKHAIGNVALYVAAAHAIGGFPIEAVVDSFLLTLKKRRVPEAVLERNRSALLASAEAIEEGVFSFAETEDHRPAGWSGYGDLPTGAQSPLRLSRQNRTADYAPAGFRLRFHDPNAACTGCAHCVTNCPEGVILFEPDEVKGMLVTGVEVTTYCKLCGECVAVCPEHLFEQLPFEEHWEEALTP